jgi:hypothetical protein
MLLFALATIKMGRENARLECSISEFTVASKLAVDNCP